VPRRRNLGRCDAIKVGGDWAPVCGQGRREDLDVVDPVIAGVLRSAFGVESRPPRFESPRGAEAFHSTVHDGTRSNSTLE